MDLDAGRSLVERWRATRPQTAPGPAPLSTVQRGILLFEQLRPGTGVFNLRFAARHAGDLDEDRLDAALSVLARRHPALRTAFTDGDDGPASVRREEVSLAARWTDLRHLPRPRREAAALEDAARVAAEPFDLARAPLVRVRGWRLADDDRLLLFVAHHLICDGGSMQVLLAELNAAYRGELDGATPAPEPAQAPARPAALEHWLPALANLPDLDLPADHARPADPTFAAGSVPVAIAADLVAAAGRLARDEGTTLFTVLLAAFQLLLGEHSGQRDFAVGVPEAGRYRPGLHGAVGVLSDLLILRADLSGRPSFRDLVRRARASCLFAFAHRGVPFEALVAALAPGRHLDGSLVRVSLAFQGDWGTLTLAGSPLRQVTVARPGIRYDVELHLWHDGSGLWGMWDYSAEAFDPVTAARMAGRLPVFLARALAEPDSPVDRLDMLTGQDRALLASLWHGAGPETPDVSLVDLFAAQSDRTPDRIAIEDQQRSLTYRQLDQRSWQLAGLLNGRGVSPGDIVGIKLGRSVDLAVAMLAIMKVGAAYLPLDPAYPDDRTDYMLSDGSARMVVTDAELTDAALGGQPATGAGFGPVPPHRAAYVLYTSGSTGRPKGVPITHRNAVAMVTWGGRFFPPRQLSRVLASTSVCFDVSVFEFFAPRCAGGTVVVVDNALSLLADPPDVTMICAVPSAARALAAAGALPASTRVVCLAGEAVTGTIVDDLYATGHIEEVVNLYGPTEDTTYSTYARLHPAEQPPPIGAMLSHGRGYVLDGALRPVPVGVAGELYLAGRGLSLGYLGQSGLTASRYVADPFAATPGERMYRSGDLARYRSDGALLYLGRQDFQVKVRGQRIELGEIETVLQRHPQVGEAVVALRDGRLVGYLAPAGSEAPSLEGIRAHLRRTLPVVMVPSALVILDSLPKTPNGKVDRMALPAPDAPVPVGNDPPRGADEELVADVWRQVLHLDAIGRDDDFFDLGGDSLMAGQLLSRLRARAGRGLPLRLVFENSRLADMAAALPSPGTSGPVRAVPPRAPGATPMLSFEQQRIWLECQFKANVAYNVHGRQWLRGPLDVPLFERCLRVIIARHESLRTAFPVTRGLPVPRINEPDPSWRIAVDDLAASLPSGAAEAAERLADAQAATSFDLARGPLLHCLLVRLSDTDHLLSMTVHHIACDGRSISLILRELSALYAAGADPGRAGLVPLPVQYLDYAAWQRATLTGERLAADAGYWRTRLAGAPPALALPTARRRLPSPDAAGGKVWATLGGDEAAAVSKLCRVHGVTPFMALLAGMATVLRRWSGQDDVVIGVPVSTRGADGTDALVGVFVNTVPLRVELAGDPPFSAVLDQVRRTAVEGYVSHAEIPFEILVRELRAVRDPLRTPLFQVMLNMIEDAEDEWRLPGIAVETPSHPAQPGKFDINLDVRQYGGGYRLDLLYHAERYEAPAMLALLSQLAAILAAAADDPSRAILDYELSESPEGETAPALPAPALKTPSGQAAAAYGLTSGDRVAVLTSDPGLALSARSAALGAGAAVLVPDEATAVDSERLLDWLGDTEATAVFLAAPLARALATDQAAGALPLLRHAFLRNRGDLTAHDVQQLRRLAPGCRVVTVYQPAALAVPIALYPVPAAWSPRDAPLRVPIGAELGGHEVRLLNAAGRPAAIGELARLRLGDADTGDFVRRRPDLLLEFAGGPIGYSGSLAGAPGGPPADPLEAVAVLRDVPGVHDAVLTRCHGVDGRPALAAYIACAGSAIDLGRVRQRLVTHLPEYLIPRYLVPLDRLPLSSPDDYDLAALPDPAAGGRLAG
jgi:amino acid adenylation domain-containing protein